MEYSFEVRGRQFTGKRIAYGLSAWNLSWLVSSPYKKASKYYPNVKIRYRPKNPKVNTVLSGVHAFHIANIIFFTIWCGVLNYALTSQASGTP
jgi:hypothetical protein